MSAIVQQKMNRKCFEKMIHVHSNYCIVNREFTLGVLLNVVSQNSGGIKFDCLSTSLLPRTYMKFSKI